jgi:hypothetical protein
MGAGLDDGGQRVHRGGVRALDPADRLTRDERTFFLSLETKAKRA